MLFIRYEYEKGNITEALIKDFKVNTNGDENEYGHATQIIWAKTNKLGCAYKKCDVSRTFGFTSYNLCT